MKKLDTKKLQLVFIWLFIISCVGLVLGRHYITLHPAEHTISFSEASVVRVQKEEGFLVIDQGNKRIVSLDHEGKVDLLLTSGILEELTEKGFSNAYEVCRAPDDSIYIRDASWGENGMELAYERIVHYDAQGRWLGVVYEQNYEETGEIVYRSSLYGPFCPDNELCFIRVTPTGFESRRLADNTLLQSWAYQQADIMLSDFDVTSTGIVYAVDKRGYVEKALPNGRIEHMWTGQSNSVNDCNVPWRVCALDDHAAIITDLGKRTISLIYDDGTSEVLIARGKAQGTVDAADANIYYEADIMNNGTVATLSGDVLHVESPAGEVLLQTNTVPLSQKQIVLQWCMAFLMLLAALLLVGIILLFAHKLGRLLKVTVGTKIAVMITIVMAATVVLVCTITLSYMQDKYVDEVLDHMLTINRNADQIIDKEALVQLENPQDFHSAEYNRVHLSMLKLIDKTSDWERSLYCDIYLSRDGIIYSPIFLDETVGAFYPFVGDISASKVLETGEDILIANSQEASGWWMSAISPLTDENGEVIAAIEIGMDLNSYAKQTRAMYFQIILSVIAAGVVLQMLIVQAIAFYSFLSERRKLHSEGKTEKEPISFVQPIVFFAFLAFNLPTAFLPNYSAGFYDPAIGIPQEVMAALPVSLNLFATALASFGSSFLIERFGAKRVGTIAAALTVGSYLWMALARDFYSFAVTMVLTGIGLGTVLNAVNSYIAVQPEDERAKGFTIYNSAFFSGVNCGVVIGALLAGWIGYRGVFAVIGVCMIIPLVLIWRFIKDQNISASVEEQEHGSIGLIRFLVHPRIFLFLACAYVPYMIAGHFLYYFMPLYGNQQGLSDTTVSQLFLVNAVAVLAMTAISNEIFLKRMKLRASVIAALVILGGGFALFAYKPSIITAVLTILIMSVANSFGAAAMNLYFSGQDLTRRYGAGRAMGVFSLFENIGDTAGPFVFSAMLAVGLRSGFFVLAASYVAMSAIFLISSFVGIHMRSKGDA